MRCCVLLVALLLLCQLPLHALLIPRYTSLRLWRHLRATEEESRDENITELVYQPLTYKTFPFFDARHEFGGWEAVNNYGRKWLGRITDQPHIKHEGWRHMRVGTLFGIHPSKGKASIAPASPLFAPNEGGATAVFVDGVYCPNNSSLFQLPHGLTIKEYNSSVDLPSAIEQLLFKEIDHEEFPRNSYCSDSLSAANLAYTDRTIYIGIDHGVNIAAPLQLKFLMATNTSSFPRVLIELQNFSSVHILQSVQSASGESFHGGVTQIKLHSNCTLNHTYSQLAGPEARHFEVVDVAVGSGSRYSLESLQLGAKVSRINLHSNLTSSGANMTTRGLILGVQGQCHDFHSSILHNSPCTSVQQVHHVILGEHGYGVFKGRVRLPSRAQDCSSEQQCRALLLGTFARLHAMPTFEISADRVSCSHGVAVSEIDENSLFYLTARGLNRTISKALLVNSFVDQGFNTSTLDHDARQLLMKRLKNMTSFSPENYRSLQFMPSV